MNKLKRDEILAHLARYKQISLKINENGKWWKNSKEYQHILPEEQASKNIIDHGFQEDLLALLGEKQRHLGFHHLNSSQAMALNLFQKQQSKATAKATGSDLHY